MRLKIKCETKKIPIAKNYMVISLIKYALSKSNKSLYEKLYHYGESKNKMIKSLGFAVYLNGYKFNEDEIEIESGIEITITTPDYNLGVAIYNAFLEFKEYKYKTYKIAVKDISLVLEEKVEEEYIKCKTLSPICIKDENNKPIAVDDFMFQEKLNYICNVYLKTYRGYGLQQPIKFINIKMKKQVIKEAIEGFKETTGKKYFYVNAYSGLFNLEGNKEDLDLLLKSGIGFRRSQGYGVFDIIK
ncbi:MAG: CRISPR-associated endoribonuclease Cas6 [Clostridium sp.]|uniref:CRISPR-associated endoribonuclease Cas6 n=1 Tax=Clostridium sp. TaxID=1506 RepID=UPI003F2F0C61